MKPYNTLVTRLFDAVSRFCTLPNKSPLVVFAEGPDNTDGNSIQDYAVLKDSRAEYFISILRENAEQLFKIDPAQFTLKQSHSSLLQKSSYKVSLTHSCSPKNLRRWMKNTVGRKKRCRVELCVLIYCWAVGWDSEENSDEDHRECQKTILSICNQVLGNNEKRTLIESLWQTIEKAYKDSLHSSSSNSFNNFTEEISKRPPTEVESFSMIKEILRDALFLLTNREQEVIRFRFGLDDGMPHTIDEVVQKFNISRERVRQIEAKALRKAHWYPRRERNRKIFFSD